MEALTDKLPHTRAVYQHDEQARRYRTSITSITPIPGLAEAIRHFFKQASEQEFIITTKETIFYAQGGGQPSDTGIMRSLSPDQAGTLTVLAVRSGPDGQIFHLVQLGDTSSSYFSVGTEVEQIIDGDKRDLNSRIHTAGHIVGLAVRHLREAIPDAVELKAQHYPDSAFVEFRGFIDNKHQEAIQAKATHFIKQALPVKVYWWREQELREKCAVVPAAVFVPTGGLLRAVDIEGAGAYPCGGTHTKDTSVVGQVIIRKISNKKGISKVTYGIV